MSGTTLCSGSWVGHATYDLAPKHAFQGHTMVGGREKVVFRIRVGHAHRISHQCMKCRVTPKQNSRADLGQPLQTYNASLVMGTGLALKKVCRVCQIQCRFGTALDLQSEFGDGHGARFVGLQGRPGLQTYKANLMEIVKLEKNPRQMWNQRPLKRWRPLWPVVLRLF